MSNKQQTKPTVRIVVEVSEDDIACAWADATWVGQHADGKTLAGIVASLVNDSACNYRNTFKGSQSVVGKFREWLLANPAVPKCGDDPKMAPLEAALFLASDDVKADELKMWEALHAIFCASGRPVDASHASRHMTRLLADELRRLRGVVAHQESVIDAYQDVVVENGLEDQ